MFGLEQFFVFFHQNLRFKSMISKPIAAPSLNGYATLLPGTKILLRNFNAKFDDPKWIDKNMEIHKQAGHHTYYICPQDKKDVCSLQVFDPRNIKPIPQL